MLVSQRGELKTRNILGIINCIYYINGEDICNLFSENNKFRVSDDCTWRNGHGEPQMRLDISGDTGNMTQNSVVLKLTYSYS